MSAAVQLRGGHDLAPDQPIVLDSRCPLPLRRSRQILMPPIVRIFLGNSDRVFLCLLLRELPGSVDECGRSVHQDAPLVELRNDQDREVVELSLVSGHRAKHSRLQEAARYHNEYRTTSPDTSPPKICYARYRARSSVRNP